MYTVQPQYVVPEGSRELSLNFFKTLKIVTCTVLADINVKPFLVNLKPSWFFHLHSFTTQFGVCLYKDELCSLFNACMFQRRVLGVAPWGATWRHRRCTSAPLRITTPPWHGEPAPPRIP